MQRGASETEASKTEQWDLHVAVYVETDPSACGGGGMCVRRARGGSDTAFFNGPDFAGNLLGVQQPVPFPIRPLPPSPPGTTSSSSSSSSSCSTLPHPTLPARHDPNAANSCVDSLCARVCVCTGRAVRGQGSSALLPPPGPPTCPNPRHSHRTATGLAVGETVILLTPLFIPIETPNNGRGGLAACRHG